MGALISDIAADPKTDQVSDFLENSIQMLKFKHLQHVALIQKSGDSNIVIPISKLLKIDYEIRCGVTKEAKIGEEVRKAIGTVAAGKYGQAIGSIISNVTDTLLGSAKGSASEKRGYLIMCAHSGAIMRIDYYIYIKDVRAKRLKEVTKNLYLCTYSISSADTSNLRWNDLAAIVEMCYGSLDYETVVQPLLKILEEKHKPPTNQNGRVLMSAMM